LVHMASLSFFHSWIQSAWIFFLAVLTYLHLISIIFASLYINTQDKEDLSDTFSLFWEFLVFIHEFSYCWKLYIIVGLSHMQILKHEWPARWRSFIPDLVSAAKTSETICENCMAILKVSLSYLTLDFVPYVHY